MPRDFRKERRGEGKKKNHFPLSPWRSINHRMTGARGEKRGINRRASSVREFKEFDHSPASPVIGFSQAGPAFSILRATQQLRFFEQSERHRGKETQSVCRSLFYPFTSKLFCLCIKSLHH